MGTFCISCSIFFNTLKKTNLLIYLFLAVLGIRCCPQAFSSCGERGLLFVEARGLSSCGSQALECRLSS